MLDVTGYRVVLSGRTVAHLYRRGDYTWLEWQDGYWDDPARPVLGLRFEDRPNDRCAAALRLPPWFSNLLPEGQLKTWVARDAGVSADREVMLLARLGHDLPGALQIEAVTGAVDPSWRPNEVNPVATGGDSDDSQRWRFSLAGVALKFSMLQDGERLTLPARGEEGHWIVKTPDSEFAHVPKNEFVMMSMAGSVGIDVPEVRIVHRDRLLDLPPQAWPGSEEWAYAVRRFDRTQTNRVHIEDLAQVRNFYPDRKYSGSFATVAALLYRRRDLESYLEFVRRLFFSYAVGNGDMHLKNVSIIYPDGRRPVISPAYDLVSTAPYRPEGEDLGLKLGRSRRFEEVTVTSFVQLANRVGAPPDATIDAIKQVAMALPSAWEEYRAGLAELPRHVAYLDRRIADVESRFS